MPLFEYKCEDCGKLSEILLFKSDDRPECNYCGSKNITKCLSAHSSMSGSVKNGLPGISDTTCCGSAPGERNDCAGPGSCCGKNYG